MLHDSRNEKHLHSTRVNLLRESKSDCHLNRRRILTNYESFLLNKNKACVAKRFQDSVPPFPVKQNFPVTTELQCKTRTRRSQRTGVTGGPSFFFIFLSLEAKTGGLSLWRLGTVTCVWMAVVPPASAEQGRRRQRKQPAAETTWKNWPGSSLPAVLQNGSGWLS
jgi:hypothetical protein